MVTFFIALLITIILVQWFILWVDKAFFEACIAELGEQAKIIEFLEEQVAAQQDAMFEYHRQEELLDYVENISPVDTPFLDIIGQGTVVKGPWHSQEDAFQAPRS